MIYTFTLHVKDCETDERLYTEYHNFKKFDDGGYLYYRCGWSHPLEIVLTEQAAIDSMNILIDSGWTCDDPKIISVYATLSQCPTTIK